MGCDIHLVAEVRVKGKWRRALPSTPILDEWRQENYEKAKAKQDAGEELSGMDKWYLKSARAEWYSSRNYNVFSLLADVRNGIRSNPFMGLDDPATGHYIVPIDSPRGLPKDLSKDVRDMMKRVDRSGDEDTDGNDDLWLGDHSHSYVFLRELLQYPWDDGAVTTAVVSLEEFQERIAKFGDEIPVRTTDYPYTEWSGGIYGQGIRVYPADEVRAQLRETGKFVPKDKDVERPYVKDSWVMPVRSNMGIFYDKVIPALEALGAPDDVRIVFGFDS